MASLDFHTDTRVDAAAEGEYAATITDRWNALGGGPNGGYLLAICVQALRRSLPFPDPLVVSAFFLRSGTPGAARVRTETARTGRQMATGEARLLQADKEIVRAVATFADLGQANGRRLVLGERPVLPPPEDCADPMAGAAMPELSLTERVEYRLPKVPGWWQGQPGGEPSMELWMRFKDGGHADLPALCLMVDAAPPVVLDIGEIGSATLELTVHLRDRPAPGWLACRVATRHVIGGYHEEDFEIWDSRGRLVAQARQLALLP